MVDAVISLVLEQLGSILQTEVNLLAGVRKESEKLAYTLTLIRGVLEDAEEKQVKNAAVKAWLEQLTRISYDADDVLDDWKTRILSSQIQQLDAPVSNKVWSSLFSQFSQFFHGVGSKMRDINEKLDGIVGKMHMLKLTEKFSERQSCEEPRAVTSSFVDDSEIYGRVDDIYNIVSMLLSETSHQDSHVPLISIVGTGGFGKTTLVQLIVKDVLVTNNFEKRMWVCVSKPFDLERVAKSIIKQDTGDVPNTVYWPDLHKSLFESIRGKKFLLVLDDVWTYDPEIWRKLKFSLDGGAQGSRIIITTRDETIAEKMGSTYTHRLGELSNEECWSFFKHIAFRERQDNREMFEEIGKKIALKCKGVPLAVKIIASLMCLKRSVLEWEDVLASDIWEVMSKDEHGFLPCLLFSYYALPSRLKRCFSYCAIFGEDVEIDKDELVKLWMAQGFLGYDSSKDLEKIGTGYFNDLAMHSLFQDFKKDGEGNVIFCKMHDLVHDFAQHLAKSESPIDSEVGNLKLRHLGVAKGSGARPKLIIRQMTCLRVLDLSDTYLGKLPHEVDRLLHLRLLNLCKMKMKELPETICNLFNLQTLKLNECQSLRKLPEGIGKLRNLRHLELEGTDELSYFPRGLERLSCLRTLSRVILGGGGGKGCQIGELKLQPHTNLAELEIRYYKGIRFRSWMLSNTALPNLLKLTLSWCIQCSELPALGRLQYLEHLILWGLLSVKRIGCEFYGLGSTDGTTTGGEDLVQSVVVFPKLHTLTIGYMSECEEWHLPFRRGVEIFPKLRELSVKKLMKFRSLALSGESVFPVLKKLVLSDMPEWEGQGDEIKLPIRRDEEEGGGFIMPCLQVLEISHCPKLKVVPHFLFSPLLEELVLEGKTGILSKSILPLISGIGSPDHNYPNLHSFSIRWSEESSLPQGFNQLTAIQTLVFGNCEFLDFLPEDLKHLPMLQLLRIWDCPILEECCRERESWTTNSHIPKIQLNFEDFIPE